MTTGSPCLCARGSQESHHVRLSPVILMQRFTSVPTRFRHLPTSCGLCWGVGWGDLTCPGGRGELNGSVLARSGQERVCQWQALVCSGLCAGVRKENGQKEQPQPVARVSPCIPGRGSVSLPAGWGKGWGDLICPRERGEFCVGVLEERGPECAMASFPRCQCVQL